MTNINVKIPKKLHKKIKIQCAVEEKTLKEFIISTLSEKVKNA